MAYYVSIERSSSHEATFPINLLNLCDENKDKSATFDITLNTYH
ncbi:hypothetical protein HMPREF0971_02703 [Segatella oris F0302]|uniref:Uncharacterized protein n=1 Tax=Segatella oris F0302 TaxID=649760 RepID=D1QUL8_9BACT|nr:hypothetical protein HMPREF0971_02703 [Segatella oris F0302]